jgi:filamentous hemagglutinin family protein
MITNRSVDDLILIADAGGGLALNASQFSVAELSTIAGHIQSPAQLILRNTSGLSVEQMTNIAANGGASVLFAD